MGTPERVTPAALSPYQESEEPFKCYTSNTTLCCKQQIIYFVEVEVFLKVSFVSEAVCVVLFKPFLNWNSLCHMSCRKHKTYICYEIRVHALAGDQGGCNSTRE